MKQHIQDFAIKHWNNGLPLSRVNALIQEEFNYHITDDSLRGNLMRWRKKGLNVLTDKERKAS